MSLRGQTAIVGYGEIPHRRRYENRSYMGLFADAVAIALKNAGIRKEEINGLIAEPPFGLPSLGFAYDFAEYIGIHPNYATALNIEAALPNLLPEATQTDVAGSGGVGNFYSDSGSNGSFSAGTSLMLNSSGLVP